jgi:hypothetical protein
MKSYVDDLFRYLGTYETNYAAFETEAFLQTYQGILAVFQESRRQRDKAIQLDQLFVEQVKKTPPNASDLRQVTVQVMITFFETVADIDGQSNKAYSYVRGLRPVRRDVQYFENTLAPLIFKDGSLNNNVRLNRFFLGEISRYLNKYGQPLKQNISPEEFLALTEPLRFLELDRRRLEMGEGLFEDRSTLEHHLHNVDEFRKMSERSRLAASYLKEWSYLRTESFWDKVKRSLVEVGSKIKGAFQSWRYTRLVMAQRNPAYFVYIVVILIFIWLAIFVPMKWSSYDQHRLEQFKERSPQHQGN